MINIEFAYITNREDNLKQLNQMLAGMKLTDLSLDDVRISPPGSRNLYLASGTLKSEWNGEEEGHTYQIDVMLVEPDRRFNKDAFLRNWRQENPDRTVRTLITICEDRDRPKDIIICHHEKTAADKAAEEEAPTRGRRGPHFPPEWAQDFDEDMWDEYEEEEDI